MDLSEEDFDDDVISGLLANVSDTEDDKDNSQPSKPVLKELSYNFLDDVSNIPDKKTSQESEKPTSLSFEDFSDFTEEDNSYFDKPKYSEYDRNKKESFSNQKFNNGYKNDTNFKKNDTAVNSVKKNYFNNDNAMKQGPTLQVPSSDSPSVKKDVTSDPIFGFKIIRPTISSAELVSCMTGRRAVTISQVKSFLKIQEGNITEDWVIAGVVMNKFTKTSQNGNQYCILKLCDLSVDMKIVSIFLFKNAYKSLWKTATGTVLGVLNPSVFDSNDSDEATLSVDNPQRVMVFGTSKDLGKCKSMKKSGDPCTAPVNLSRCEYCVYHVKQEYSKFSKRSDLQSMTSSGKSSFGAPGFGNKKVSQMSMFPGMPTFVGVPAKKNEKQCKKDNERLALLRGTKKMEITNTKEQEPQAKARQVELTANQVQKDHERLNKLRAWGIQKNPLLDISLKNKPSTSTTVSTNTKVINSSPKLSNLSVRNRASPKLTSTLPCKTESPFKNIIDLSQPIPQKLIDRTKQNAIEWVKRNGGIKKVNPNKMQIKEILKEKGLKRKRSAERCEKDELEKKKEQVSAETRFQQLAEMKSSHADLLERRDTEETEKYFGKLEVKERMEEQMLTTFKVDCKAVRCSVCKYVAFSSSELCKTLQHPIKVIDAVKRFFKCSSCGNRTISLDRLPSDSCGKCLSSKWVRAPMMDERRTQIKGAALSIRGAEEKFIGSVIKNASLDLLVPDPD